MSTSWRDGAENPAGRVIKKYAAADVTETC
jgi:hypothetical protein